MRLSSIELGLAVLLLAGCGASKGAGNSDGGAGNSSGVQVEVGTGNLEFQTITSGSTVMIVCGAQGLQHIWTSVRAKGLDPSHVSFSFQLNYEGTPPSGAMQPICAQSFDDVTLSPNGDWDEFSGQPCIVLHPADVDKKNVVLSATVTDQYGVGGSAEVHFIADGPGHDCSLH